MLIHVNVSEDVYMILSVRAEQLEMSIGKFCAKLVSDCAAEMALPDETEDKTVVDPKGEFEGDEPE